MRLVVDSPANNFVEDKWPDFKDDPRNMRLGLATHGISLFTIAGKSQPYLVWPVVIMNYNIPPWMSMKKGHLLLSMVIPGPKQPKSLDVYMAPLIEELQELWDGVPAYDNRKRIDGLRRKFDLRAILLWTMHDYPGFGFLSGLQTKSYMACPTCGPDLKSVSRHLEELHKIIYLQHTQYLESDHPWRKDSQYYLNGWNSEDDVRPKPVPKTPQYWKGVWERVYDPDDTLQYERCDVIFKSSLNDLEYWPHLLVNHLLDPMHIEGNIGKSLIKHLYGEKSKNWREACVELNMHPDLWSYKEAGGRTVNPSAPWVLSKEERKEFRRRIGTLRFPTNYGANLRRAFGENDLDNWPSYLKTHDWHRLLQHILPVAIIGLSNPDLRKAIWSLGKLLRWVCSKTIKEEDLEDMDKFGAEVLCDLERCLPPSFFNGQVHLLVHLAREVKLAGPVHCRWMYWVERYMGVLKRHVRNKQWVKGSIAEGHLATESMFFCTSIMSTINPNAPRGWVEHDDIEDDRLTGATKDRRLSEVELHQVNTMMLSNSEITEKWRDFYEGEKTLARRPRTFPTFLTYMRRSWRIWMS
ncbi:unnamed protein product [Calypogeia fissa]